MRLLTLATLAALAICLAPAAAPAQTVSSRIAVGVDHGVSAVRVFDVVQDDTGETSPTFVLVGEFVAFARQVQGARVAVGDVNHDGVPDVIVGAGPGGRGEVKVVDGTRLDEVDGHGQILRSALLADFFPFGPNYRGDVNVGSGDVTYDGYDDVVVGAGPGGRPLVRVYDGAELRPGDHAGRASLIASFLAFDSHFRGGVSVAAGDQNDDGHADIIVGARTASISTVNVFDGSLIGIEDQNHNHNLARVLAQPKIIAILIGFVAYPESFTGGVLVASARGITDGTSNTIVTGPAKPGDGTVNVFQPTSSLSANPKVVSSDAYFRMFGPTFIGGVRVAAGDIDGDGIDEILGASSPGTGYEDTINIVTVDPYAEGGLSLWGSFKPFGSKAAIGGGVDDNFTRSGFFVGASKVQTLQPPAPPSN